MDQRTRRHLERVSEKSIQYQVCAAYSWTASAVAVTVVAVSKAWSGWSGWVDWLVAVLFITVSLYEWRALSDDRALLAAKRLLSGSDAEQEPASASAVGWESGPGTRRPARR